MFVLLADCGTLTSRPARSRGRGRDKSVLGAAQTPGKKATTQSEGIEAGFLGHGEA